MAFSMRASYFSPEDQVAKIENGGLFSESRCKKLTQYILSYAGKCSKCMMIIKMECCKLSLQARCSWIFIVR